MLYKPTQSQKFAKFKFSHFKGIIHARESLSQEPPACDPTKFRMPNVNWSISLVNTKGYILALQNKNIYGKQFWLIACTKQNKFSFNSKNSCQNSKLMG